MKTGVTHYYAFAGKGFCHVVTRAYHDVSRLECVTCKRCLKKLRKTHPAKTSAPDQDEKAEQGGD